MSCWSISDPVTVRGHTIRPGEYRRCTLFEAVAVPPSKSIWGSQQNMAICSPYSSRVLLVRHNAAYEVCADRRLPRENTENRESTRVPHAITVNQSGHGNFADSHGKVGEPRSARPVSRLTQPGGAFWSKHVRYWPVKRVKGIKYSQNCPKGGIKRIEAKHQQQTKRTPSCSG